MSLRAGFTLLELILVMALIALVGGLSIVAINVVIDFDEDRSVETHLQNAIMEARYRALSDNEETLLRFDSENRKFIVRNPSGTHEFGPVGQENFPVEFEFQQRRARMDMILIRGQLVDTRAIERVRFFPDGSSEPFLASWAAEGFRQEREFDLWTEAHFAIP
ncbi:MAG: type II secretion system protein [Opitutales bacterium]|nr:type II secretion system protein [Opitutales bacterium]MCH8539233.1 type II secretion system GspH family protein [Opitutales bacterium]